MIIINYLILFSGNTKEVKREVLHVNHVRLSQSNAPSLSSLVSGKVSPKDMVSGSVSSILKKETFGTSLQSSGVSGSGPGGPMGVGSGTTLTAVSVTTAAPTVKSVSSLSPSSMASSMSVSVTSVTSSKLEAPSVSTLSGDHANDLEGMLNFELWKYGFYLFFNL